MLVQQYTAYTGTDHEVWKKLYTRQLEKVKRAAYSGFAPGLEALGISRERIPDFSEINLCLETCTGWQIYPVAGLIPNDLFFTQMNSRKFGATTWIRKPEELDYLEEPDMFHDIFGHIPLLADPQIADYLQQLARVAVEYTGNEYAIEAIARLYWYTIEFGLVKEGGDTRIYGAGILSSISETEFCLSDSATRIPFDLEKILTLPYIKDRFQEQYFVLDSMDQLAAAVPRLELLLDLALSRN